MNLDRALYKKIKGMNREEMNSYMNEICNLAYNKGISDMSKELAKRVDTGIRNTPGIGEKRYAELISNINIELNKEISESE